MVALPVVFMKPLPPEIHPLEKRDVKKISGRKIESIYRFIASPS